MFTFRPFTRERVRGFQVYICKIQGKPISEAKGKEIIYFNRFESYANCNPYFSGEEALKFMKERKEKNFDSLAWTTDEDQWITLEEMDKIFGQ